MNIVLVLFKLTPLGDPSNPELDKVTFDEIIEKYKNHPPPPPPKYFSNWRLFSTIKVIWFTDSK